MFLFTNHTGHFAVATFNNKQYADQKAQLWSRVMVPIQNECLNFAFLVHGWGPGTMSVKLVSYDQSSNVTVWSFTPGSDNSVKDKRLKASLPITFYTKYYVSLCS